MQLWQERSARFGKNLVGLFNQCLGSNICQRGILRGFKLSGAGGFITSALLAEAPLNSAVKEAAWVFLKPSPVFSMSRCRKRPAKHGESWSPVPTSLVEEATSPGGYQGVCE